MGDAATFTAFVGHRRLASGSIEDVAQAIASLQTPDGETLILDDATGQPVELDLRSGPARAALEYRGRTILDEQAAMPPRGRGRPRLGVVAREVTLLPRHWDWLASQPGGASAALRRLVEDARRSHVETDRTRRRRDVAYRVMAALGGDLPGFEEASRALFAGDDERLHGSLMGWPPDVRAYVASLIGDRR